MDVFSVNQQVLSRSFIEPPYSFPENIVWIDLLQPTPEEIHAVEKFLNIDLPTSEEMGQIEVSNRLFQEGKSVYMTTSTLMKAYSHEPEIRPISFVIVGNTLVTIRYVESTPFKDFMSHTSRLSPNQYHAVYIFIALVGALTNRLADILERIGHDVDMINRKMFRHSTLEHKQKIDFQEILWEIGRSGDLISKVRETLVSINRMAVYFSQVAATIGGTFDDNTLLQTEIHDLQSLLDHASFLTSKLNFILDATLGKINIEQNVIIKIFSLAAVIFLPPTLVASTYGMNFKLIPELDFKFGYPMALGFMVLSAVITYQFFKRKGWL
ncbi:MAG: magnesium transporter CorA family protein [Alphaproteobacteria bacterium]|nr:magnesium transporter CorA family protein [Alphaproteobacteria bacterium]